MEWTEEQKREMYEDGVRSPHPAPSLSQATAVAQFLITPLG